LQEGNHVRGRLLSSVAVLLIVGLFAAPAAAVTADELLNLKANGLSDEILVALIESDGSVFRLSADDVLTLRQRGLSEKVILAMLATTRRRNPPVDPRAPAEPIVVTVVAPAAPVQQAPPVQHTVVQHVEVVEPSSPSIWPIPIVVGVPIPVIPDKPVRPVYWGFGGELRPDAWRPAPGPHDRHTVDPSRRESSPPRPVRTAR
jgi:hypothetical protein